MHFSCRVFQMCQKSTEGRAAACGMLAVFLIKTARDKPQVHTTLHFIVFIPLQTQVLYMAPAPAHDRAGLHLPPRRHVTAKGAELRTPLSRHERDSGSGGANIHSMSAYQGFSPENARWHSIQNPFIADRRARPRARPPEHPSSFTSFMVAGRSLSLTMSLDACHG